MHESGDLVAEDLGNTLRNSLGHLWLAIGIRGCNLFCHLLLLRVGLVGGSDDSKELFEVNRLIAISVEQQHSSSRDILNVQTDAVRHEELVDLRSSHLLVVVLIDDLEQGGRIEILVREDRVGLAV